MELRCDTRRHGNVLIEDGLIEVRCKNARCGHRAGVIILHRFRLTDGALIETLKFKDPVPLTEGATNGARRRIPVRHS